MIKQCNIAFLEGMSRILNRNYHSGYRKLVKKLCYELDDNLVIDSFRKAYDKRRVKIGKETIRY